jgi:hypothetical protein
MNEFIDGLFAITVVAGILVLTKPGSQGPALVENVTSGYGNILGTATGGVSGALPYAQ